MGRHKLLGKKEEKKVEKKPEEKPVLLEGVFKKGNGYYAVLNGEAFSYLEGVDAFWQVCKAYDLRR